MKQKTLSITIEYHNHSNAALVSSYTRSNEEAEDT